MKDAQRFDASEQRHPRKRWQGLSIRMSEDGPSSFDHRHAPSVRLFIHPLITTSESLALAVPPVGQVYRNREAYPTIMSRRNHPHACWPYTERIGTLPIFFMIEPSMTTAATIKFATHGTPIEQQSGCG